MNIDRKERKLSRTFIAYDAYTCVDEEGTKFIEFNSNKKQSTNKQTNKEAKNLLLLLLQ